jgi:hypothetical protein
MVKTDKFPDGKLNPDDEGELSMKIGVQNGRVILDFGTPVTWLGMHPAEAVAMAGMLIKHARTCAAVTGENIGDIQ